jgi:ribose transport system substrate-binding protein
MLTLVAAVATACGSDDSSDDSGSSGDSQSDAGGSSSACADEAQAAVDAARAPLELKAPEKPLDLEKLEGKSVWMVLAAETPFIQSIGEGFEKAAAAAGMEGHVFPTPGAVTAMNQGVTQAVTQGADGISLMGVAPELVADPLSKAVAQDIPFVDTFATGTPDDPLGDAFAHVTADWVKSGETLASWAVADSDCQANMAILSAEGPFPNLKAMVPSAEETVEGLCPDDCKVTTAYYDIAKIATEMGTQTQSVLRRDPNIDYVFAVMDAGVQFVGPALQQAGKIDDVKVLSHDGVDENLDDIRAGGTQDADLAFVPAEWIGWATVDQLGRAILGEEPQDWTIPVRLVDETNVGSSNADIFPEYDGFEAEFERRWRGEGQ